MRFRVALLSLCLLVLLAAGTALVAQSADDGAGGRPVSGDCENGYGVMEWRNGARYTGTFRNGVPHGSGEYRYADGGLYRGEYRYGKRHGQGTYTWPSGAVFRGDFRDGDRHEGEMRYSDKRIFDGKFAGNQPAAGEMRFPDGRVYEGQYRDGKPHGKGTMTKPNRETLTGRYEEGRLVATESTMPPYNKFSFNVFAGIAPHTGVESGTTVRDDYDQTSLETFGVGIGVSFLPFGRNFFSGLSVSYANRIVSSEDLTLVEKRAVWEFSLAVGARLYFLHPIYIVVKFQGFYNTGFASNFGVALGGQLGWVFSEKITAYIG